MKLLLEPEAEEDLRQLESEHQEYILERLKELEEKATSHSNSDNIQIRNKTVFKYVMKEGERGGKDFRAVYDISRDQIRIIVIFHRDKGYDKDKISDRL